MTRDDKAETVLPGEAIVDRRHMSPETRERMARLADILMAAVAEDQTLAAAAVVTADLTGPRRGAKRRYLPDRPLTPRERYELRRARKKGELPVLPPPRAYSQQEYDAAVNEAYSRGYEQALKDITE